MYAGGRSASRCPCTGRLTSRAARTSTAVRAVMAVPLARSRLHCVGRRAGTMRRSGLRWRTNGILPRPVSTHDCPCPLPHCLLGHSTGRVNRPDPLECPPRGREITLLLKGGGGDGGPGDARRHHLTLGELLFVDRQLAARPMNNHVGDRAFEVARTGILVAAIHRVKHLGFRVPPENADHDDGLPSHGEHFFIGERQSLWTRMPGFLAGALEPLRHLLGRFEGQLQRPMPRERADETVHLTGRLRRLRVAARTRELRPQPEWGCRDQGADRHCRHEAHAVPPGSARGPRVSRVIDEYDHAVGLSASRLSTTFRLASSLRKYDRRITRSTRPPSAPRGLRNSMLSRMVVPPCSATK